MRLNYFIAQAGICSRRAAVNLIKQGLITVNHFPQTNPAYLVQEKDTIRYNKQVISLNVKKIYIVVHKPIGFVTTTADEHGRPTVLDLLPKNIRSTSRLFPVGRLDHHTSGLILLTNDGELTQALAHPRYEVHKKYIVTVDKPLKRNDLRDMCNGIRLSDGKAHLDHFTLNAKMPTKATVTIHSGKKHIIRRLFEARGYRVEELMRVSFGPFTLHGLGVGSWKEITDKKYIEKIYADAEKRLHQEREAPQLKKEHPQKALSKRNKKTPKFK
jgi:23S rRNA pseudouridine2605 synthase